MTRCQVCGRRQRYLATMFGDVLCFGCLGWGLLHVVSVIDRPAVEA